MEQDTLLKTLLGDESPKRIAILVPDVDREHYETFVAELLGDTTEVRSLRTAGGSPIGPECQEHRLAARIAKPHGLAIQSE